MVAKEILTLSLYQWKIFHYKPLLKLPENESIEPFYPIVARPLRNNHQCLFLWITLTWDRSFGFPQLRIWSLGHREHGWRSHRQRLLQERTYCRYGWQIFRKKWRRIVGDVWPFHPTAKKRWEIRLHFWLLPRQSFGDGAQSRDFAHRHWGKSAETFGSHRQ